ncbi:MAG: proline dehydrogenase, partial [Rufibacter sp.]
MNPAPNVSFEDTAIAFADKSDAELYKTYLLFAAMNSNSLVKMGGGMMKKALNWNLPVKFLIKKSI